MAEQVGDQGAMRWAILPTIMALAALPAGATRHPDCWSSFWRRRWRRRVARAPYGRGHHEGIRRLFDLTERLTDATRSAGITSHVAPISNDACITAHGLDESAVLGHARARTAQGCGPGCTRRRDTFWMIATSYVTHTLASTCPTCWPRAPRIRSTIRRKFLK